MNISNARSSILGFVAALTLLLVQPLEAAVFKIATLAPEGSAWMKEMRAGANEIRERTAGRVTIKFFGGGVMGNDKKVLRKIRIGQLQGGAFTAGALAERYRGLLVYGLPLVFRSQEEVDYVRKHMDGELIAGMEEAGFVSFGFSGLGFAMLMSKTPVRGLDDLKGRKVWTPEGDPVAYAAMKTLGLSPVTLPLTDVMTGLQTGLIDIVAASPVGAVLLQWHTKINYVTDYPLAYLFGFMAVDRKAFDDLGAQDRATVKDVMGRLYDKSDQLNRADNENAAKALKASGLEFVDVTPKEIGRWRALLSPRNRELAEEGLFPAELLDKMESLLTAFRDGKAAPPPN